jgi:hypothetical protein
MKSSLVASELAMHAHHLHVVVFRPGSKDFTLLVFFFATSNMRNHILILVHMRPVGAIRRMDLCCPNGPLLTFISYYSSVKTQNLTEYMKLKKGI